MKALGIGSKVRHYLHGHIGIIQREIEGYWGIYWFDGAEGAEHADRIRDYRLPPSWIRKGVERYIK